jgi:hypothetical protein
MTDEIVHLSTVEFLTKRPAMMTASGSLAEVLAFFDGFERAVRPVAICSPSPTPVDALSWLAEQCGYSPGLGLISPKDRLERIIRHYGSSEAALAAIDSYATTLRESQALKAIKS